MTTATASIGLAELEELADTLTDVAELLERLGWSDEGRSFPDDVREQLTDLPAGSVVEPALWQALYSLTSYSPSLRRDVAVLRDVLVIAHGQAGDGS